jgi:hypothetical protein
MGSVVIQRHDDQAARALERKAWISAARVVQVFHFAGITLREPFGQVGEFFEILNRRNAAQVESFG